MKNKNIERIINNNHRLNLIYNKYKMLSLNMFRWEGLPETVESRHIENSLFNYGLCLIVNDKDLGFISVPCNYGANMNVNNVPTEVITCGFNYIKTFKYLGKDKENCQLILNNDLAIGNEQYIFDYAERMFEVEKCIRVNINQQKFPWFVNTTPNNKKTMETMFEKVLNGEPYILGSKDQIGNIEVLTLNTPYIADKLNEYKYELEREILSFHGLNNNFEKKERLLVDEVNSNNDFIDRNVELMYRQRQLACEQMNKKFGWNVKVINLNEEANDKQKLDLKKEEQDNE